MQSLVDAKYVLIQRDNYMLQYVLTQRDMLSTTGYRVLQSQEEAGLIPCYHVSLNSFDKLDYDVEQYSDLESLLPEAQPGAFVYYVHSILAIVLNLRNIGFLHPANLETSLDKIFIDLKDSSVHMVYLPIEDKYLDHMNKQYEKSLKTSLLNAIHESRNPKGEPLSELYSLLSDDFSTLEQIKSYLDGSKFQNNMSQTDNTASISQTGEMSTSGSVSDELISQDSRQVSKKDKDFRLFKKSIFKKRTANTPQLPVKPGSRGTEVLGALFIPSIVLLGPQKDEILIKNQDFVIGKQIDKVDYAIGYSTAVSRIHCKVSQSESRNFITDLGSSNGTYVNGRKLEPQTPLPINDGDKVKLGNVSFIVRNI